MDSGIRGGVVRTVAGLLVLVGGLSSLAAVGPQSALDRVQDGFVLTIDPAPLAHRTVVTPTGSFAVLSAGDSVPRHTVGLPALPTYRHLFGMPQGTTPRVTVLGYEVEELLLEDLGVRFPVMPTQPPISKSARPDDIVFQWNAAAYAQDAFDTVALAAVTKSGDMRGVGIGALVISPFRYNPAAGGLRVYKNLKIQVHFDEDPTPRVAASGSAFSPFFSGAMKSLIYLPEEEGVTVAADLTQCPVTYLIVASEALSSNAKLADFVAAKRKIGFNVLVNYVAATATPATVDAWIETQYATLSPKPSFVLIVGDESGPYTVQTDVDPPLGAGTTFVVSRSDLRYGVIGDVAADNRIPSMYVGRFSVRSLADLNAQVDKTLWYERGQFAVATPDLSYLQKPLGAAGQDDNYATPYGNPHISYEFNHYLNAANGMPAAVHYLHPDAATRDTEVVAHVSGGVSFYNYTAHGNEVCFGDPYFSIANIDALGNSGRYPLVIGNCCLTGSFGTDECFGEAWLNAPNKGAVGYIGASMSTSWRPDLVMGVGTYAAYNNPSPPLSQSEPGMIDGCMMGDYPTQAALKHVGLLAVENDGGSLVNHYWLSFHLFGDPSLMIHLGIPTPQTATHDPTVTPGTTSYQVTTTPGAYVALVDDSGVLHGAAVANASGVADLTIAPFFAGNANLAVTAQFRQPLFKTIPVAGLTSAYVDYEASQAHNCVYGETGSIDLTLKNFGVGIATGVTVLATTPSPVATTVDGAESFGNIAAGATKKVNSAITLAISNNVADQQQIKVDLSIRWGTPEETNNATVFVSASAPKFAFDVAVSGGGSVQPGDERDLTYTIRNDGHASASGLDLSLQQLSSHPVTLGGEVLSVPMLGVGQSTQRVASVIFGSSILPGSDVALKLSVLDSKGLAASFTHTIIVGITDDFESGTIDSGVWLSGGDAPWTIDTTTAARGAQSAKSGVITHSEKSTIELVASFPSAGSVSFFRRVSSEENYDFLTFYIDGVPTAQWSGDVPWGEVSHSVSAGRHTLAWRYAKDDMVTAGDDCAWLDDILLEGGSVLAPPSMALSGTPLTVSLLPGTSATLPLAIRNEGGLSLSFCASLRIQGFEQPLLSDGFESADFSVIPWAHSGTSNWMVNTAPPPSGTYCAKSGGVGDSQASILSLPVELSGAGDVSFSRKVSSEAGYDYLQFSVNGELRGQWSGEHAWAAHAYRLSPGTHTLKWAYVKDSSESSGSDCAWLDDVRISEVTLPSGPWVDLRGAASVTGLVEAAQEDVVPVHFHTGGTASGIHTGTVEITHNAAGAPRTLPLTLKVLASDDIESAGRAGMTRAGTGVSIAWDDVTSAQAYQVYCTRKLGQPFVFVTETTDCLWSADRDGPQMFYKIIAIKE